jgi:hypothetical protein
VKKGEAVLMFFEEDPLDRWCRCILAYGMLVARLAEIRIRFLFQRLAIRGRHLLFIARKRTYLLGYTIYRRYICVPLMLFGVMRVPTWTEVEAYRVRLSTRSGFDLPRPPELEEGLKQEQMQKTQ